MKLVLAVVHAEDAGRLLARLSNRGFRATRIRTAGGFLREVNTTIFAGVEDADVEAVLHAIRESCTRRRQRGAATRVEVGGATIFVLNVARFERA